MVRSASSNQLYLPLNINQLQDSVGNKKQ